MPVALVDPMPIRPTLGSPGAGPFRVTICPPGSKSLTNRALLLAALGKGRSMIRRPLLGAEDAEHMLRAVAQLGARVERLGEDVAIEGVGGRWAPITDGLDVRLDLGNAGTAVRFLAAASLLSPVPVIIDGDARMQQRPIGELVDVLRAIGADVRYLNAEGCPPIRIATPQGRAPAMPAALELEPTLSSQFISALLLIAPWLAKGLTLKLIGPITSASYVAMTVGLLDRLGAIVRTSEDLSVIRVAGESPEHPGLRAFDLAIEPDASGATYFWGAAALIPGAVCRVQGLDARSLQGDAKFPDTLSRMGATIITDDQASVPSIGIRGPATIAPVMADLANMPDAAMTLAAVACFAGGRSVLRGLKTLRHKETDRLAALTAELGKIGVKCETQVLGDHDTMTITPPPKGIDVSREAPRVEFDTYRDHRMAMALALIGLRRPNVFIRDPGCVAKTYPQFWRDFEPLQGPRRL